MWVHIGITECQVPLLGTVTLTSDLISRIIMSEAYLLYLVRYKNPKFVVWVTLEMVMCHVLVWGHFDLGLDLRSG